MWGVLTALPMTFGRERWKLGRRYAPSDDVITSIDSHSYEITCGDVNVEDGVRHCFTLSQERRQQLLGPLQKFVIVPL